jgi:hypothetical protein
MFYHATPRRNLESIGRLGLLSGKRVLELGVGELTTGWQSGASYIHVCDNIDDCARWIHHGDIEFSRFGYSWYIIRFDQSAAGVEARRDPKAARASSLKRTVSRPSTSLIVSERTTRLVKAKKSVA